MSIQIKDLGLQDYAETYTAMQEFNQTRHVTAGDQIWLLEHWPVYTLGLSVARQRHPVQHHHIPIVNTDRGGQITYHGPGQLIAYLMIDLNKRPYKAKKMVWLIEQSLIDYLQACGIEAERKVGAPGVYIQGGKIAALGLRVRGGCTYHGLALNVDMDLTPFGDIDPCGYARMKCVRLSDFINNIPVARVKETLPDYLIKYLDKTDDPPRGGNGNVSGQYL